MIFSPAVISRRPTEDPQPVQVEGEVHEINVRKDGTNQPPRLAVPGPHIHEHEIEVHSGPPSQRHPHRGSHGPLPMVTVINHGHQLIRIIRKHWLRFRFVNIEASLDNPLVCIVEAVVLQGAFFEPIKKRLATRAREMKDFFNIDHSPHNLGLANIPRNTVQHEFVDIRFKFMGFHSRIDCLSPELHGDIVRDELAFARVFKERFADFRTGVDGAKYIATRAMVKAWDRAERLALCTFAAARRAKKDEGIVSHERSGFILQKQPVRQALSSGAKSREPVTL